MSALLVGVNITRSLSVRARVPVNIINLPKTDIIRTVRVVVLSVSVVSRLMLSNAFAAILRPVRVLGAIRSGVNGFLGGATIASRAVSRGAVATTVRLGDGGILESSSEGDEAQEDQKSGSVFHSLFSSSKARNQKIQNKFLKTPTRAERDGSFRILIRKKILLRFHKWSYFETPNHFPRTFHFLWRKWSHKKPSLTYKKH